MLLLSEEQALPEICANPLACAIGVATIITTVVVLETKGEDKIQEPGIASVLHVDPDKPAKDVVPGSLKREFPGEHLDKSLNQIRDELKKATGKDKASLQKAKKIIEQADRLLDKVKGRP